MWSIEVYVPTQKERAVCFSVMKNMYYPVLIIMGLLLAGIDAWMMACVRDKLPLGLSILCKGIVVAVILVLITVV